MSEPFYAISFLFKKVTIIDYYISNKFHGFSFMKDNPAFKWTQKISRSDYAKIYLDLQ